MKNAEVLMGTSDLFTTDSLTAELLSAVDHSLGMSCARMLSGVMAVALVGLVTLGGISLARRNWRSGVWLGLTAFLWAQLAFPVAGALGATAAVVKLLRIGSGVSNHFDVVLDAARQVMFDQRLPLLIIPVSLGIVLVGLLRTPRAAADVSVG